MRIDTAEELARAMGTPYTPSPQQWRAISAPLQPSVVIAGAGSGKTTLMAARVVYLVLTGQVRPEEVLGLTFTAKAASELRERILTSLTKAGALAPTDRRDPEPEEEVLEPTVATYNAYAAGLLTDHGLRIGHEPDTRVITDAARYQLGARAVQRYTGVVESLSDHPPTVIQNLLALDGAMSEHLVSLDQVASFDFDARQHFQASLAEASARLAEGKRVVGHVRALTSALNTLDRRGELLGLVASYRRLKRDLGLMDFADQIELGARLASEQPEVGALERGRFKVVLLDEYQDTSVAQAIMLSRLFGGGHAVTAVGDPNQAIYGWRGASVSNILGFGETFPRADGEDVVLYPLTVNRRSDRRILEVANRLAAPLLDAYPQVAALEADPSAGEGRVEAGVYESQADELGALAEAVRRAYGGDPGDWAEIGVLTRDNLTAAAVYDALTSQQIPVEIVGLSGLLRLPEIAEVVATLNLVHDVTANAALLTLLSGPRWAIGPRDLRLLAQRAHEISGRGGRADSPESVTEQLLDIADGVDPAEITALDDALVDPGDPELYPYSASGRERFGLLAAELRMLRSHAGEPILDLVRRIIDTTGIDVELASAVDPAASARRDNLDLFVRAVADFQAIDGDVSLAALLAYLTAEDEQHNGLDVATPTEADSVKLLTVHRSKGLEWRSVFLVGVCATAFPSERGRNLWISSPAVLPTALRGDAHDLPQLDGWDKEAIESLRTRTKAHDQEEELRLGYVAFTRAAEHLSVTSHLWRQRKTPFGPSAYQEVVRDQLVDWGEPLEDGVPGQWLPKPDKTEANPFAAVDASRPWPVEEHGPEARLRLAAAELVRGVVAAGPSADEDLDMLEAARVAEWDEELDRLLAEARAGHSDTIAVPLPGSLSATAVARLRDDPAGFARELARPMPRPPSSSARFGTRFHAWVEARFGQQDLFDPDDLPGRADAGTVDEAELREVIQRFEAGPFGSRPPFQVEAPFALVLAGQVIRGRIDAVYTDPGRHDGPGYLLVDWKTHRSATADPLQLALYRLAWAELRDVPLEQVRAAFYYVRSGELVEPRDLPDRAALEELIAASSSAG
ncbi:ATP-dependent DNA helicase [Nocardioides insulae]|uniref:ATP-dependent DNA helicase n=1 Tax=Nocardioides insulae TaxID=394734 RepID=UPI0004272FA6|nr:ATP-dependent DNA helicase [Nocardioides insulae]